MKYFIIILTLSLFVIAGCKNGNGDNSAQSQSKSNSDDSLCHKSELIIVDNKDSLIFSIENAIEGDSIIIVDLIETDKPLIFKNKKNIVIKGDYGIIKCAGCKDFVIIIDSCENITIENLAISNGSEDTLTNGIINIVSSKNIVISKNDIGYNTNYAVKLAKNCDSIMFSENSIHDCITKGIEILSPNTLVKKNIFFNNGNGTDDLSFGKKIEALTISEENEFKTVDHSLYIDQINKALEQKSLTEKQSNAPDGIETISGYYDDDQLVYIEYTYSEEDEQIMTVYFKNDVPVYIHNKNTAYASPDKSSNQSVSEDYYHFLKGNLVKWEHLDQENPEKKLNEDKKAVAKKQKDLKTSVSFYIQTLNKDSGENQK